MATDLVPGTGKWGTIDPAAFVNLATGTTSSSALVPDVSTTPAVGSVTQNPLTNVEAGRTQAKSSYDPTQNSNGKPIPDFGTTGAVDVLTLVSSSSTATVGVRVTAAATTVVPSGGTGCTISYTPRDPDGEAETVTVSAGGSGYQINDIITVTGDTGVSGYVSSIT